MTDITQSRLHQFMVSSWLHFCAQSEDKSGTTWKECGRRRRRSFFDADRNKAQDFAAYIINHSPECERVPLGAVIASRIEHTR